MIPEKEYLGDSVYVRKWPQGNGVKLFLQNGEYEHDTIFLEDTTLLAFLDFLEKNDMIPKE